MSPRTGERKVYLGDAVYAAIDRCDLVLTTEDGIRATNTIVLEPEVLRALLDYVRANSERAQARKG
jgi:hypothetical protein